MDEAKPFYKHPKKQVYLAVIITSILYLLTLGHQGIAQDVILSDIFLYTTLGRNGGVSVINVLDPQKPEQIGLIDTRGTAKRLARKGSLLFVADGNRGLTILDVADPTRPSGVGMLETFGDTQDVSVTSNYAFLANGAAGIWIIDISNPTKPAPISVVDTPGNARGVYVSEIYVPSTEGEAATPDASQAMTLWGTYVYVADGKNGLLVIEVLDPRTATIVGHFKTNGEARDIYVTGPFAYIAEGNKGIQVVDITDPASIVEISSYDTPGNALSINISANRVYISDDRQGVSILDVSNPSLPVLMESFDTSGSAYATTALENWVYVADGNAGIKVMNISRPGMPQEVGVWETPGYATVGQMIGSIVAFATGHWKDIQDKAVKTFMIIIFDLVVIMILLYFWLGFFSQFVLPVRTLHERRQAMNRMINYHFGSHGPAIFIENGQVRKRTREEKRAGAGVALLDTASGAVFRNAHAFTQAVGPGIVFTKGNEYLAGTVDLHIQNQSFGPVDEKDNPFDVQRSEEDIGLYTERQNRRQETSGLTRDGVEVVPKISATFRLISEPGQGGTQFGFSPESVWRAIAREGFDPDPGKSEDTRRVPWNMIPARLATDLWREYLRKYTLDELFNYAEAGGQDGAEGATQTAFDRIVEMVNLRLTRNEVSDLNEVGLPTGESRPSREYDFLQERGILVENVSITNLFFPPPVELKLVDQWKATWLLRAMEESKLIDRQYDRAKTEGQNDAIMVFATDVSSQLGRSLTQTPPGDKASLDIRASLESLVRGTLRLCHLDADLRQRLSNQPGVLQVMIDWIREK